MKGLSIPLINRPHGGTSNILDVLTAIPWRRGAPRALVNGAADGPEAFGDALSLTLPVSDGYANKTQVEDIIDALSTDSPTYEFVLDGLDSILQSIPSTHKARLWCALLSSMEQFESVLDSVEPEDLREVQCGELLWRFGLLFSPLKGSARTTRRGYKRLRRELLEQTDLDGCPSAKLVPHLEDWLGSLLRSAEWGDVFDEPFWDDESRDRLQEIVITVLRLAGTDGQLSFHSRRTELTERLAHAGRLAELPDATWLSDYLAAMESTSKVSLPEATAEPPGVQSDWAEMAVLRSDWQTRPTRLAITHNGDVPQIDLHTNDSRVLLGDWGLELKVGGRDIALAPNWECVCWNSDADADYLELQFTGRGVRVCRQALLVREDDILMLADSVVAMASRTIEYVSRLPLDAMITLTGNPRDRSLAWSSGRRKGRIFPVGIPQDRSLSTSGGFGRFEDDAVLRQATGHSSLFAPVVIDWNARRRSKPVEWRQLTVTESGKVVAPDEAAAYRLRVGAKQYVMYRSFSEHVATRALLGHQTNHESMLARFDRKGTVEPILLVEA